MKSIRLPFIAVLALTLISIISLGYLLKIGQTILAPIFFAFLLALLFEPFANFLERKLYFHRGLSTIVSVLIVIIMLSGLSYFFGSQLVDFREDIPHLQEQSTRVFHELQEWVTQTFNVDTAEQFNYLNQAADKLLSSSGAILGFTLNIFTVSLGFFGFSILFFIFILNYRRTLNRFIIQVFSDNHKVKVQKVVAEIQDMTKSYIVGIFIQIFIVSLLTSALLSMLGVKYAILLGVLTGLLNVIPYIGIAVSLLIACFITFATNTPITCLYVFLGYLGIHAIDGNIIVPFVVGSKVKINALFSFIGIILGEQLLGIAGMFLCIPALAILRIVFENIKGVEAWGNLLGEEEIKKAPKKSKFKIRRKRLEKNKKQP